MEAEAKEAATEERELAVEEMADATEAEEAPTIAVSTDADAAEEGVAMMDVSADAEAAEEGVAMMDVSADAEAVAKGTITGDRVTEPVDTDALSGMMIDVVYPLIAIGKTGPDGAGC